MKRFYSEDISGLRAVLSGSERDHCVKVLRTNVGEVVEVVDGKGGVGQGVLSSSNHREAAIDLSGPLDIHPHEILPAIAIAIPKNPSRWEYFLEKATEIGVGEIVPLICHRSEKARIREERSRQIILSAFKQSLRLYLPKLHVPMKFADLLKVWNDQKPGAGRYIAYCTPESDNNKDDNPYLGVLHQKAVPSVTLIGPEGDFTPEEISLASGNGFSGVSLGQNRLRVETAGITACTIIRCIDQIK